MLMDGAASLATDGCTIRRGGRAATRFALCLGPRLNPIVRRRTRSPIESASAVVVWAQPVASHSVLLGAAHTACDVEDGVREDSARCTRAPDGLTVAVALDAGG